MLRASSTNTAETTASALPLETTPSAASSSLLPAADAAAAAAAAVDAEAEADAAPAETICLIVEHEYWNGRKVYRTKVGLRVDACATVDDVKAEIYERLRLASIHPPENSRFMYLDGGLEAEGNAWHVLEGKKSCGDPYTITDCIPPDVAFADYGPDGNMRLVIRVDEVLTLPVRCHYYGADHVVRFNIQASYDDTVADINAKIREEGEAQDGKLAGMYLHRLAIRNNSASFSPRDSSGRFSPREQGGGLYKL
jgi:hypothetical protein